MINKGNMGGPAVLQHLSAAQQRPMGGGMPMQNGPGLKPQPNAMGGQQTNPDMAEAQIRDSMAKNPQMMAQIQQQAQQLIQSGELTPQEIETAVKLAKLALRDPNTWPQIRRFAIQQGIGTEQDIPQQYDVGLIYAIIALGEALQAGQQPGQMQQPGQPMPQAPGGAPQEGYMIPQHVVKMKGQEFFDTLVGKYDPEQQ